MLCHGYYYEGSQLNHPLIAYSPTRLVSISYSAPLSPDFLLAIPSTSLRAIKGVFAIGDGTFPTKSLNFSTDPMYTPGYVEK